MEYVYNEDIWKALIKQQAEKPLFYFQSPHLKYREKLINRLREICNKFLFNSGTLHTAVDLMDQFMDTYNMHPDRLYPISVVCLYLAAKSDVFKGIVPPLGLLLSVSNIKMTRQEFRSLEFKVGQNVKWRLLAPTVATFAVILSKFVVTDDDLATKRPPIVLDFKVNAVRILEEYLDFTLSELKLKLLEPVDVGCACVAITRTELGLMPWPNFLACATMKSGLTVYRLAKRLQRMKIIKSLMDARAAEQAAEDPGYDTGHTSVSASPASN